MLGRNTQTYVDGMVITSKEKDQHIADLEELFRTIVKYNLKLNLDKCVIGVEAGKFLSFLLTERHRGEPRQMHCNHRNEELNQC